MASLTNTKIKDTYDGLLKTTDNDALGGTYKLITDGLGNSSGVYLGTGGNVGIGTTSPNAKLTVDSGSNGVAGYINVDSQTTNRLKIGYSFTDAPSGIGAAQIFVDSSGNLDISSRGNNASNIQFYTSSGTSPSEVMRITSSGNVGIGTTDPNGKLDIATTTSTDIFNLRIHNLTANSTQSTGILFNTGYTSASRGKGGLIYEYDSSLGWNRGDFHFLQRQGGGAAIAGLEDSVLTIKNNGNVGIGTTSPDTFLHIDSASTNNIPLKVESGASTSFVQFMDTATTANFKVRVGSSGDNLVLFAGGSERMRINSSGNVQIGSGTRYGKFDILNIGGSGTNFIISAGANGDNYFTSGTSGIQVFRTGLTERMRINSSGNVGIGTSSITDSRLQIKGANNTTNAYADGLKVTSNNETVYTQYNWNGINNNTLLLFATGGTERMRITSSGFLYVGTQSFPSSSQTGFALQKDTNGIIINNSRNLTTSTNHIKFYNPNGLVGSISTSGSSTSYNTSSDYRLKENVVDMTGALNRIEQLQPKRFNFISDAETTVDGFIAHEVQSVIPEAVFGEKDAVDDEGNPDYQGIDQSKIVPLLVGAIKELKAEIETLKSQINS